jgi:UDP-glucose 4-epimerase
MNAYSGFYQNKKILITGGLGFVGSNLAHHLVDLGAEVLLVDSMIPAYGGNLFNVADIRDRVNVNIMDIRDTNALPYLVRDQDIIFNLAGQVSHIDSMLDPHTDLEINCASQLSLLETCRHHNPGVKIVFASTRQIYGQPKYLPVDENHIKLPKDVNGINKMAGEWYHIVYNNVYGIQACSIRMTNTYGPRQLMKHNRQGFIPWFIRQAMDGQEITLFGDGHQVRDITYIDDAIDAFLRAAATDVSNGRVFNLGGIEPVSLLTLVETLVKVTGRGSYRIVPFPDEKKSIDIGDYYANYSKIKKFLGWEPKIGLAEGLTKTVEYYRKHREHYWTPE